jgi:alpha-galactosidase
VGEIDKILGDQWERSADPVGLDWMGKIPHRRMPWYFHLFDGTALHSFGVKTGGAVFAWFECDTSGITLWLDARSGGQAVELLEPLLACEVVCREGRDTEIPFRAAEDFCRMMCEKPNLPKEPIFGVNNWYWAYGRISHESVATETDQLMQMTEGTKHRPYIILDDGWQLNRTYGKNAYIGGPWLPNDRFGDMRRTADMIRSKGAKAGIWFRPLLTLDDACAEAKLSDFSAGGVILDPTHPYTLEQVEADARTIRSWGYDLIKHDFTTMDILGMSPFTAELHTVSITKGERSFFDSTVTTATAIKRLYEAIQRGAGDGEVIGCNAVGHLLAGIHSVYRTGGDTSGRSFEWTRRNGVNTMMRLPLNDAFYRADPDCAAFTERVDTGLNLDFLEMCALTGVTTLASVTPGILRREEMERINSIYRLADRDEMRYGILDFETNSNPEVFGDEIGDVREFDWERAYHGARHNIDWLN